MRVKGLLAAFLLGAGLCFVPVLGYGKVEPPVDVHDMDIKLLKAQIDYIMENPTTFLNVSCSYNHLVSWVDLFLPEKDIDTAGKIFVIVTDNRGVFSGKSWYPLLDEFQIQLEAVYSCLEVRILGPLDLHTDIVAAFYSEKKVLLGYYYQGEYRIWK